MVKVASWMLVALLALGGVAYGADGKVKSGRQSQWSAVETLSQDALVEVGREGQAGVEVCRVERTDVSSLTCVAERQEGNVRLIFPRDVVRSVWLLQRAKDLHIGRWIAAGVGIALIVAACVEGGLLGLAAVGTLVVGVEISYFEHSMASRPPQTPRVRRRLIYSVP